MHRVILQLIDLPAPAIFPQDLNVVHRISLEHKRNSRDHDTDETQYHQSDDRDAFSM
jgi:hypothetical protein